MRKQSTGQYNNHKDIRSYKPGTKIYEGKKRHFNNNSYRRKYLTFRNEQKNQAKN